MSPKKIVFLCLIAQFFPMYVYACLEQHKNNSYLGFVIMYSVSAIIISLCLLRMRDD